MDETRDFLSSSSSSFFFITPLYSLPPYVFKLSPGSSSYKHLYKSLWQTKDKHCSCSIRTRVKTSSSFSSSSLVFYSILLHVNPLPPPPPPPFPLQTIYNYTNPPSFPVYSVVSYSKICIQFHYSINMLIQSVPYLCFSNHRGIVSRDGSNRYSA